jgi:hypothetical protein
MRAGGSAAAMIRWENVRPANYSFATSVYITWVAPPVANLRIVGRP